LTEHRIERRLAAILAADVAGYSRLTGLDEEGTHVRLRDRLRGLADPKVSEHRGKIVKYMGDGLLAEFASVVDAARCAIEVQRDMAERNATVPQVKRIEFRIGIHVGDIIVDENDIFGDGVNIAARLEGIAEPGGVCISDDAQRQIRGKVDIAFEDMGPQNLKNISEPMRAWRLRINASASAATSVKPPAETIQALPLPDKPSIAVLPFQNMSGDPEQEYFADGMVEDIVTALSHFKSLFVIARNSSFTYKGKVVDIKQVGRELGVRYVLEGSVRKAANRVRITGQLIDAATGAHLWADRFDGALEDVFDLQDRVATSVVGAIAPTLEQAEIERSKRKPVGNLDAYDCYLRGMASLYQWSKESNDEALRLLYRSIELDPNFVPGYGAAAWCYVWRKTQGWVTNGAQEKIEATRLARRAVELGKDDAVALSAGGITFAHVAGDLNGGAAFIERALVLNPNLAGAWLNSGWVKVWLGEPEAAIEHLARAMRLSPLDPILFRMQGATASAHLFAGHYDEASSWAEKALRENPNLQQGLRVAAASHAFAGRLEEAQKAVARIRQLDPDFRISNMKDRLPAVLRSQDFARYAEGLRKAGVPE
jgi:TolB-like protein/class 3 adenylate cyclase